MLIISLKPFIYKDWIFPLCWPLWNGLFFNDAWMIIFCAYALFFESRWPNGDYFVTKVIKIWLSLKRVFFIEFSCWSILAVILYFWVFLFFGGITGLACHAGNIIRSCLYRPCDGRAYRYDSYRQNQTHRSGIVLAYGRRSCLVCLCQWLEDIKVSVKNRAA